MIKTIITLLLLTLVSISSTYAHSGRTDKNGCHNEKATGTRHCH